MREADVIMIEDYGSHVVEKHFYFNPRNVDKSANPHGLKYESGLSFIRELVGWCKELGEVCREYCKEESKTFRFAEPISESRRLEQSYNSLLPFFHGIEESIRYGFRELRDELSRVLKQYDERIKKLEEREQNYQELLKILKRYDPQNLAKGVAETLQPLLDEHWKKLNDFLNTYTESVNKLIDAVQQLNQAHNQFTQAFQNQMNQHYNQQLQQMNQNLQNFTQSIQNLNQQLQNIQNAIQQLNQVQQPIQTPPPQQQPQHRSWSDRIEEFFNRVKGIFEKHILRPPQR